MKSTFKILGFFLIILLLFRGSLYRAFIKYNEVGTRPNIEITNQKLIETITNQSSNVSNDLKDIVSMAEDITNHKLSFTFEKTSNDPNVLINSHRANCVGYSAMFNSIANYLIKKHHLENDFEAQHKVGQLELLGINLHQYFESPFFQDHDFN